MSMEAALTVENLSLALGGANLVDGVGFSVAAA